MNIELYNISVDPESPLRVTGQGGFLSGSDEIAPGITMDEVDSFSFDYNMKTNELTLGLELNEPDIDNFDSDEEYYEALDKYRTAQPEFDQYDVPEFAEALRNELMDSKDLIEEFNGSINQGDVEAHRVEDDKYLTVEGKIHMGDTVFDFKSQNSYAPDISYRDSLGEEQPAPPWVMMHTDLALAIEQEYESLDVSYEITRNDKGLYDIKGEIGSNLATPFSGTYDPATRELDLHIDMEKSQGIYEIKDEIKGEIKERIENDLKERSHEALSDKILSKLLDCEYNYLSEPTKFKDIVTELGYRGVDLESEYFKEAWLDAYNRAEDIIWGPTEDQSYVSSFSPCEIKVLTEVSATLRKEGIEPDDISELKLENVTTDKVEQKTEKSEPVSTRRKALSDKILSLMIESDEFKEEWFEVVTDITSKLKEKGLSVDTSKKDYDIKTLAEIISEKLDTASNFNLAEDLQSFIDKAKEAGIDANDIYSDIEDIKNGTINAPKIQEHVNEIRETYDSKESDKNRDTKNKDIKDKGMDI